MNEVKLGDVADVRISGVDKKTLPNEIPVRLCNYTDVYYNWTIRTENRQKFMLASAKEDEISKFRLHAGQVALTKDSETKFDIGHSTFISEDFDDVILGYHCALISPHPGMLDGQYLNAMFRTRHISDYLARNAGGSGQRYYLSEAAIKSIPLKLPPITTQLRIAAILGSIDEKIELNRKKIAELEALTKTIYDYWFVQFDFPDKNGKPYKSSGGKMVWNEQLKREIPEGWGVGTVGELGEIVAGGTPSTDNPSYWSQDGIAWITPKDLSLTNNKYIRHGEHDISEKGLCNSSAQLMPRRSVLLSTRAPIGYIAVADCDICTNQGFKSIVPNGNYGSEFIYYSLSALIPYIKTLGVGSTFAEVSKSALSVVQLAFPRKEIVMQFENVASQIGNNRRICELAIEKLIRLRDTLLPLLMNGQVKVKE